MRSDISSWIALRGIPEIGDRYFRRLIDFFGSAEAVCAASLADLLDMEGIGPERARNIHEGLRDPAVRERAHEELKRLTALGASVLAITDPDYPSALREIDDPPPLLFIKGTLSPEDRFSVAVVGSRDATEYGLRMAARISTDLARKGLTVVSGGARGVDGVAHRSSLQAGGRTVAVLGSGLDVLYPPENRKLFAQVEERGALVTEFCLGTPPDRGNFPRRNRVISGLTLGVVVVEASRKSGSLITATAALEQGREVFAVPGHAGNPNAQGTNDLIRKGARLTESGDDVLDELHGALAGMVRPHLDERRSPVGLSALETAILKGLAGSPKNVDRIAADVGMGTSEVLRGLLGLELRGTVRQLPGGRFVVE